MDLQQCRECRDNYPKWMIFYMDATSMCKICILSGQIKANRDMIDEVKLDIDLITGRINESIRCADDNNSMRKEIEVIEEKVKNIEKVELNFSGFITPDFGKANKERKEEIDEERKSRDGVADENDWEMLKEDVGNMITSGIKEIRENVNDKQGREENLECSLSRSSVVGSKRGKEVSQNADICIVREEKDLNIKNKFSLLKEGSGDEERVDYSVLGNSNIKKFQRKTKTNMKRNIYCSPEAGMERIVEHIENGSLEGDTVVIHGGGDDIKGMNTEKLMELYKNAIEKVTNKGKLCIISGILPRLKESPYWSSRAIGINDRVREICKTKPGVMFVDSWDSFYNNRRLYSEDGIQLNKQGSDMLSILIDEKVHVNSNLESRRQGMSIT